MYKVLIKKIKEIFNKNHKGIGFFDKFCINTIVILGCFLSYNVEIANCVVVDNKLHEKYETVYDNLLVKYNYDGFVSHYITIMRPYIIADLNKIEGQQELSRYSSFLVRQAIHSKNIYLNLNNQEWSSEAKSEIMWKYYKKTHRIQLDNWMGKNRWFSNFMYVKN